MLRVWERGLRVMALLAGLVLCRIARTLAVTRLEKADRSWLDPQPFWSC